MITIPETDLVVHPLCLGSNIFGSNADEAQSHTVMDAYSAHAGNFIDTADMYNQWVEGHVGGESETVIGSWMKKRNNRQSMVIATKVSKMDKRPGLSAKNIFAACEESLNRLQTDYIDLYYSHSDDETVSLEETLGAYAQLIAQGKVRYIAASNFTPARLRESIKYSEDNNIPAYVAVQNLYNLVDRKSYEGEMSQAVLDLGISNIPFYGIARGFLTGKYRPGVTEVDSKRAAGAREYATDKNYAVLTVMDEVAKNHNASLAAVALAWLRAQPSVSVPIASARTVEQVEEIIQVVELSVEEVEKLNGVSA
ncbi:Tas Predicted oxidoreductases (related to aryl-alcohol dehydrogenases) [Candidatus Planktophila vernalis]|uniref:aldo/keto reductase n=1 Tax=Candidatus Planktophila vernalis TaxID=1884907 RepID=UPI003CF5CDC3